MRNPVTPASLDLFRWVLPLLLLWACGGGGSASGSGPAPPPVDLGLTFKASPIDPAAIRWITPLGNLNPPDHPLPTDHIYFYFADPDAGESPTLRRTAFFAPGDGTVSTVLQNNPAWPDLKVFVTATGNMTYYVDHLIPDAPLTVGMQIRAGQRLGTTGSVYAVDLGLLNSQVRQPFLNPGRYVNSDSLNADAPLRYFEEPLRTQLYGKVQRLGSERDGRIAYDVAGRLSGNWFSEYGAVPLAFAQDTYDPTQVRLSVPGFFPVSGVFGVGASDPFPGEVTVGSGKVRYSLTRARTGLPIPGEVSGTLLVQMLDEGRIRVESFPPGDAAAAFTANAREFLR